MVSPRVRGLRVITVFSVLVTLVGCASVPRDLGHDDVADFIAKRGLPSVSPDAETAALLASLLAEPLSPQAAVHVALLQNPRVRLVYSKLGFAAADIYEAGRLSNPGFSVGALDSSEGGTLLTFGLAQSFTDLLTLPARSRLAEAEFERLKRAIAAEVFNLAADVEAAYYRFVATEQIAAMRAAITEAAQASAELASRFHDAGNINRLELALEQAAASEARLALVQARSEVTAARAELGQLLGVPADVEWAVMEGLPMPLETEDDLKALVALAFDSRLDLDAAVRNVERLADSLGVTRTFRWLGGIEVGIEHEREPSGESLTGPTLSLELPIFNQNADEVTRAEAALMAAEAELRALHLGVGREVQLAYADVLAARRRIEEYRQTLIPLREDIVQRTQEQVNYMLMGVFELLRAKEQTYDAYEGYLEAVGDYWLARVELKRAVGTSLPSDAVVNDRRLDAKALTTPESTSGMSGSHEGHRMEEDVEAPPMDHSGHQMNHEVSPAPSAHHGHETQPTGTVERTDDGSDVHQGQGAHTNHEPAPAPANDEQAHHNMQGDDEAQPMDHGNHGKTDAATEASHNEHQSAPPAEHAHHGHGGAA